MEQVIILQSADIHGEIDGLARIATLVESIRQENPNTPIFYMDCGDSQDRSQPLSAETRGCAMYHLLGLAGCQVSVMSNKNVKRYGMSIWQDYRAASGFPIVVSNILSPEAHQIAGTQPSVILEARGFQLGVIGVSADEPSYVAHQRLQTRPAPMAIRQEIDRLRAEGIEHIVLLSHMGIHDDTSLGRRFQEEIPLVLGGHSHSFTPMGRKIGKTLVSHVGAYARHIARIDLTTNSHNRLKLVDFRMLRITRNLPPHPVLTAAIETMTENIDTD
jgi:2',3'-cyclic-nucleotide 2'-phosphodiesterase (5'-nucleotidase family)